MEAVALLANYLIMSCTSIRSFRHLEHQNPSIISEDIGRARQRATIPEEESDRRSRIGSDRNTVVLEDRMYTLVMYEYLFQILTMVGTYVSSGVSSREAGAIAPASMRPIWSCVHQALLKLYAYFRY